MSATIENPQHDLVLCIDKPYRWTSFDVVKKYVEF